MQKPNGILNANIVSFKINLNYLYCSYYFILCILAFEYYDCRISKFNKKLELWKQNYVVMLLNNGQGLQKN